MFLKKTHQKLDADFFLVYKEPLFSELNRLGTGLVEEANWQKPFLSIKIWTFSSWIIKHQVW